MEQFDQLTPNKEHETDLFEEQFSEAHHTELFGHEITYIDCVPEIQQFATPLFMAPGWSETPNTFKEPIQVYYEAGRRVLSVEHPRFTPRATDENDAPYLHPLSVEEQKLFSEAGIEDPSSIPVPELIKARSILAVATHASVEKMDVVAHSEGAINVILAATMSPQMFRHIILCGAAGVTERGSDNALKRTVGALRTIAQDVKQQIKDPSSRNALTRASVETMKYIAQDPATAVDEVGAIASFNIEPLLTALAAHDIKISFVHGTDDHMFAIDEMQKLVENDAVYEFFSMPEHTHHSSYLPDEATFVEQILESMEQK